MSDEKPKLYHERQKLQLCALHSLNSLFQEQRFTKKNLDDIVAGYDKSWCWNEYSTFVTGNYDLTIILEALRRDHYTLRAIDNKESFDEFQFKACLGLLLNIPLKSSLFDRLPVIRSLTKPGRHWLTIKRVGDELYYDFDSKHAQPQLIGNQEALIQRLETYDREQTYMYFVIRPSDLNQLERN